MSEGSTSNFAILAIDNCKSRLTVTAVRGHKDNVTAPRLRSSCVKVNVL